MRHKTRYWPICRPSSRPNASGEKRKLLIGSLALNARQMYAFACETCLQRCLLRDFTCLNDPHWVQVAGAGTSRRASSCSLSSPSSSCTLSSRSWGGGRTIYFRAKEFQSSLPSSWEDCLEELSPDVTMRDFLRSNLVVEEVVRVLWGTKSRQGVLKSPVDQVKVRHSQGRKYDAVFYLDVIPGSPVMDHREDGADGGGPVLVQMPFDSAAFTFYDASSSELLFWFNPGTRSTSTRIGCKSPSLPNGTDHAVLLNPFPVHNYSSILVPFFYERRSQVLSQDVLEVALAFSSEFRSRSFRLSYNSLGATASVNHLNFKLWQYSPVPGPGLPEDSSLLTLLPIERANFRILTQEPLPIFELEDYPLYALAFDVRDTSPQTAAPIIQCFIDYCLRHNIPHSLLLNGMLLFLVPRKPMPPTLVSSPVHPEVWGEVRVLQEHDFDHVSADEVGQAWKDLSLTRTDFEVFYDAVLDHLKPKVGGTVSSDKRRRKRRR